MPSAKLSAKAKRVRLLLLDVDGVLTDGRLYIGEAVGTDGRPLSVELKAFHIQDGHAMKMAARGGLIVGWVSSRHSPVTARRAKELGIRLLAQPEPGQSPPPPKLDAVRRMAAQEGVGLDEVCFVGDDLVDLPVLATVGLPVAVANGVAEVRRAAVYVTRQPGGDGAVREVIELILKGQGKWDGLLERYRTETT
ncbi:MAG: HAD hydrolase family protein [Verrucomicrobia bacterium]|nr:HAD hydrolase family protein [Verrucomicrobiota bacterium]